MAMCLIFGMACLLSRWCVPVSGACLERYAKDARNARMLTLGHDRGVLPLGRPMPRTVYVLALASAFCSACATIFIRQGLRGRGPYTGFWINLVVGTVGLWAAVLLTGGFDRRGSHQPAPALRHWRGHPAARRARHRADHGRHGGHRVRDDLAFDRRA